jgi:hypothetical protein
MTTINRRQLLLSITAGAVGTPVLASACHMPGHPLKLLELTPPDFKAIKPDGVFQLANVPPDWLSQLAYDVALHELAGAKPPTMYREPLPIDIDPGQDFRLGGTHAAYLLPGFADMVDNFKPALAPYVPFRRLGRARHMTERRPEDLRRPWFVFGQDVFQTVRREPEPWLIIGPLYCGLWDPVGRCLGHPGDMLPLLAPVECGSWSWYYPSCDAELACAEVLRLFPEDGPSLVETLNKMRQSCV